MSRKMIRYGRDRWDGLPQTAGRVTQAVIPPGAPSTWSGGEKVFGIVTLIGLLGLAGCAIHRAFRDE